MENTLKPIWVGTLKNEKTGWPWELEPPTPQQYWNHYGNLEVLKSYGDLLLIRIQRPLPVTVGFYSSMNEFYQKELITYVFITPLLTLCMEWFVNLEF